MSDIDKCREAFEAWRQSLGEEAEDLRREGDGYYMYDANQAWHGWQAAWNATRPKPPAANAVRVRIPLLMNRAGDYYARRSSLDGEQSAIESVGFFAPDEIDTIGTRLFFATVDVPKPEVAEVRGEVTT